MENYKNQDIAPLDHQMPDQITDITHMSDHAKMLFNSALSDATKKAYEASWADFKNFCEAHQKNALGCDVATLVMYLTDQSQKQKSPQTIQKRLAAIKFVHEIKGLEAPVMHKMVATIMKGIRRTQANRTKQNKLPIRITMLENMMRHCDLNSLKGLRDYAVLIFGFSGAFRRSEICNIMIDDLEETAEGLKVYIRQSKTDQEGAGQIVALPHGQKFPVTKALKDWLRAANIHEGYIFRSIRKGGRTIGSSLQPLAINQILKEYLEKSGYDPDQYGAHSLRSGFLTEAAEHGASLFKMLEVSRHKSADMVLHYVRTANLFKDHAGEGFL